jgi:Ca2+-binding RTX toxin-like protein
MAVLKAANGNGIVLKGTALADTLIAGEGDQTLYGTAGNDLLIANTGDQQLYGGSGDDWIVAGLGNQLFDGGSGLDTLDFSNLDVFIEIDIDLHYVNYLDPSSKAQLNSSGVWSFDTIIGSDFGNDFWAAEYTPRTYIGGKGNDRYRSESGGDTVTGGEGSDIFGWMKKYVIDGKVDHVTDFEVGVDKLNLTDFLKGQGIKNATYDQVVRLVDQVDEDGTHSTLVQTLSYGTAFLDTAILDGVDSRGLTVYDFAM